VLAGLLLHRKQGVRLSLPESVDDGHAVFLHRPTAALGLIEALDSFDEQQLVFLAQFPDAVRQVQNCFILVDKCPGGGGISGALVASFLAKVGISRQFFAWKNF
jgi:hypothetical protein